MISAQKLHREFIRLGGMRHKLKNRMLAILPEIYKSEIYKKYAGSIVEYAGKFGDIAKTTVIKRLRLEKNLENKPYLKAAIEKVGVHKVALVAKIATSTTDKSFAENISNMSRVAVQSLSKELRSGEMYQKIDGQNCEQMDFESDERDCDCGESQSQPYLVEDRARVCRAIPRTTKIELDEESTFFLMKLKVKLGKHLSDQEFLKLMLKERVRQEFSKKLVEKSENKPDKEISSQSALKLEIALRRENMAKKNVTGGYKSINLVEHGFRFGLVDA